MTLRGIALAILTLAALGLVRTADALPVALAVDGAATSLDLGVSVLGSNESAAPAVAGTAQAEITVAEQPPLGDVPTSVQLASAALSVADTSFFPALPAGISLTLSSSDVGASLSSPLLAGIPVAPGISLVDFAGTVLSLDAGTFAAVGAIFATPIDVSLDLAATPLDFVLPLNATGQAALGAGSAVTVRVPFDQSVLVSFPDLDVELSLLGTLVLVGEVPEPGSLVLLGLAGAAVAGLVRRR